MSVKTVSSQADAANPLGYEKEGKLLVGFAIPCIISMLRQYLNDWSHSLITFIRYFSELVPIFMGNHSLCRISGFEIEDQPLTLSTLEFLLMDQVDFRYPLLGGVEPVMITSLLSS